MLVGIGVECVCVCVCLGVGVGGWRLVGYGLGKWGLGCKVGGGIFVSVMGWADGLGSGGGSWGWEVGFMRVRAGWGLRYICGGGGVKVKEVGLMD